MKTVSWICALLLLLSILPATNWFPVLENWYPMLLRSFISAGCLWLAWKDYRYKSLATWNLALVMMAVFYNPLYPFLFETTFINGAIALLCVLFLVVFANKREPK